MKAKPVIINSALNVYFFHRQEMTIIGHRELANYSTYSLQMNIKFELKLIKRFSDYHLNIASDANTDAPSFGILIR